MVPSFSTFNCAAGMFLSGFIILGIWYTNSWNTGYLPIVTNRTYDHFGKLYNVSRTIDERGFYDHEAYMKYSAPYIGAANAMNYGFFFAVYSAIIAHVALNHRYEIMTGFKSLFASFRRKKDDESGNPNRAYDDVHNRLMAAYPEGMFIFTKAPLSTQRQNYSDFKSFRMVVPWHPRRIHCSRCPWYRSVAHLHLPGCRALWYLSVRHLCHSHRCRCCHDRY